MPQQARQLPPLPLLGCPESYYARQVHQADAVGDLHAREAAKVGQYITLAKDPDLTWPKKLKYFDHALRRHCNPPPLPDEDLWLFYRSLADLVRHQCGEEALKLASAKDDEWARRIERGESRDALGDEASEFFIQLMGHTWHCPNHFIDEDWKQLKLLRDQWV
jgi:hypothetical protein